MPVIIVGIIVGALVGVLVYAMNRKKQQVNDAYFSEQIRRGEEKQKQMAEAERQKRMMQRERAGRN